MGLERVGMEDIKAGYQMYQESPFYAVFERANGGSGTTKPGRLLFSFKDGDRDKEGWQLLEQNLRVLANTAPTLPHIIQFYDDIGKKDRIDSNTPYTGSFTFRMQKADSFTPAINGIGAATSPADMSFLNYLQTELRLEKEANQDLRQEVQELEEELEEYRHQPEGKEIGGIIGHVGEAGNKYPWIADIIKDWSTVIKHTFTGAAGRQQQPSHISGIDNTGPPDQRVNNAIKVLVQWYADEYGQGDNPDEKMKAGFTKFADDMQALASLTTDNDMMHLALKKLRATAA